MCSRTKSSADKSLLYQPSIAESLYEQQQIGLNVDLKLISGRSSVFVHSAMLLKSDFLASLLQSPPCSCSPHTVLVLPSVYSSILLSFVSMLYTGYIEHISKDEAKNILDLAKDLVLLNVSILESEPSVPNESSTSPITKEGILKLHTVFDSSDGGESSKLSFQGVELFVKNCLFPRKLRNSMAFMVGFKKTLIFVQLGHMLAHMTKMRT